MPNDNQLKLSDDEAQKLRRSYEDLKLLAASCQIPSVRAAVRVAVAELHAALCGQGLEYELYSHQWSDAGER